MKKVGEIMKDLGFNEEAPNSVKEAFIRHLVKSATGVELPKGPHEKMIEQAKAVIKVEKLTQPEQLSFNFEGPSEKKPTG